MLYFSIGLADKVTVNRMKPKILYGAGLAGVILVLVGLTALFVPTSVPAYEAAVAFVRAAGQGDEATASASLATELQAWVRANCRDGRVSACVDDYTPADWGQMLTAVFRRAQPAGSNAFDVQLVATYTDNQGFSGVCIYTQVVQQPDAVWRVTRWSGWNSCDDPNGGLANLISSPSVPNRAP